MRRTLIAASATLALLSGAAFAQTTAPSATSPSSSPSTMSNTAAPVATDPVTAGGLTNGKLASADALIGKNVYGRDNDKLGEVDDVILDTNGQAKQLVIGSGGFLGIGEKKVAVEYNAANWDSANNRINLSGMSRDDVKAMPEFKYDDTMTSFNRSKKPAGDGNVIAK
ncbi:PRC-barrel domain-containing protein [Azospirillum doebereinerae]|uniref:PRC-barrel domain containing protein n=1 Tax=Azospirillum doebereinerae TaxID=92933 RepID=A0A433J8X8_9PROT|nr:PRC-barrel domain-containing protein [Azospirillum doebereinerae]MCG5242887.1 PRC-barrel domain-containing protein [Azospirillum doebereinerae]RUQ70807.1 PRC-barrel domain containing protein [Azospirillum doebereinerae]